MRALDPSKSFVMIRSSTSQLALAFPKNIYLFIYLKLVERSQKYNEYKKLIKTN